MLKGMHYYKPEPHIIIERHSWEGRRYITKTCVVCGSEFKTQDKRSIARFCSKKCMRINRRVADKVIKICVICDKQYVSDKYRESNTCSYGCRGKLQSKTKQRLKQIRGK